MDLHPSREERLARSLARHRAALAEDPELARSRPDHAAIARIRAAESSIGCVALSCALHADRPALGERAVSFEGGVRRALPRFETITYEALWSRVRAFASGLRHAGLVAPGDRVIIDGFASVDWVVADLACLYLAAVSVPLQTRLPEGELAPILAETAPRVAVCSARELPGLAAALGRRTGVRAIVLMDLSLDPREAAQLDRAAAEVESAHDGRVAVLTMAEVARLGHERGALPFVLPADGRAGERDPLMTLLYTSGSTGSPKGAMFPENLVLELWRNPWGEEIEDIAQVGLGYMPLNHAAGRFDVIRSLSQGGLQNFTLESDMSTLFADIRLARPTRLLFIPRVSAMIHQTFQAERLRRTRGVADEAARARLEEEILAGMRASFLGDRLVMGAAGSAPTAPEILDFLERCFDIPVIDTYGSTEAGFIARDGRIVRGEVLDFEIESVPELGYHTSDVPHPRGELLVKTRRLVPGYYQNPAASRALFDARGFLRTGDIVERRGEDEIVWLDRRKNVLKLSQGEFVSTSRLEVLYAARSPFIDQIFVHGSAARAYLLAVVVPDLHAIAPRLGPAPSESAVTALLRQEIERIAGEEQLHAWEVPRGIIVSPEPFTRENGLLTASNKPSRPKLGERFGARLAAMYEEIERRAVERLAALEDLPEDAPIEGRVAASFAAVLGLDEVDLDRSFPEHGGDSIAATRLASVIEERTGVEVPVGMILDGSTSARALAVFIEHRLAGARGVSFADIHGAGSTVVRAADLDLDRFLDARELAAAAGAHAARRDPRAVLLTGASGFLGRFLLLELLDRLPPDGHVTCLTRAPSDQAALARIAAGYRTDPRLEARFRDLAAGGRLVARAGDLMKPRLGLDAAVFEALAEQIDLVVHDGALVNHALAYPQLFQPNVVGTAEILRFAITAQKKPIAYVSTVGVAGGLARVGPVREDEGAVSLSRERPGDGGYAVGYATSKWAGEVLLGDVAERFDVPTSIFRCSMIMPPRGFAAQVNAGDFFIRLLVGVMSTGLAPASFHAPGVAAHFDGLPVDFTARSIAAIALDPRPGQALYHVVNPHWDDGISLDTIVAWIRDAGHDLRFVEDHARWFEAFRNALRALPADLAQRSPLPMVHQWARPLGPSLRFDAEKLEARLAALGPDLEAEIPKLDRAYVEKIASDIVALGLVPAGRRRAA